MLTVIRTASEISSRFEAVSIPICPSGHIMPRVLCAAPDKMPLNAFQAKAALKIRNNLLRIQPVFTGVDIRRKKAALRKGVDAHVALGDKDDAAPAAGVFLPVWFCPCEKRLGYFSHANARRQFIETR